MKAALEKRAKDALAMIQFFEGQGRKIKGVTIDGGALKLEFTEGNDKNINHADFVRMD